MEKILRFIKAIYCWCIGGCRVSLTAEQRMNICMKCEHNSSNLCSLCGCVLKYKTKMDTEKCPIKKW